MFKVLLISLVMVCCGAQYAVPKRVTQLRLGELTSPLTGQLVGPASYVDAPIAIQEAAVAVAPAPAIAAVAQPIAVGQLQYSRASPFLTPIHHYRTQEVLPIQELNAAGQLIEVQGDQQPVLVRFQTHSAPVQIETSHIPSPQGEVSVTQVQDEPHRVIHEVIRPVIQEVREIIQPYRKVTQEIRPVEEQVHTEIASGAPGVAPVAVGAPALVSAPAQAVYGSSLNYAVQPQVQEVVARPNFGVIAAPAPLYTGSYIQAFLEQYRARTAQAPLVVSQPKIAIDAPVIESVAPVVDALEPVAAEAIVPAPVPVVGPPKLWAANRGAAQFSQKYREY